MKKIYSVYDIVNVQANFSKKDQMFLLGTRQLKDNKIVAAMVVKINEEDNYNLRLSDNTIACGVSSFRFLEEQGVDYDKLLRAIEKDPILLNAFGHPIPGCICNGKDRCSVE